MRWSTLHHNVRPLKLGSVLLDVNRRCVIQMGRAAWSRVAASRNNEGLPPRDIEDLRKLRVSHPNRPSTVMGESGTASRSPAPT